MTTRSEAFITSVEVRHGAAHDYATIWVRHQCVGTLCLGKGDGEELRTVLLAGEASTHPPELTPWQGALDAMRDAQVPFVLKGPLAGAPNVEPIPQQLDRLQLARALTRSLHAAMDAETRKVEQRMVESRGNWLPPLITEHPIEAEQGAPAPSPPAAKEPEGVSLPAPEREPPAAGAPRSFHNVCLECWKANAAGPPPPELGTFTNLICHSCGQRAARGVLIDVTPTPAYNTWRRRLDLNALMAHPVAVVIDDPMKPRDDEAWRDEETIG